jgi:hypothetical protein
VGNIADILGVAVEVGVERHAQPLWIWNVVSEAGNSECDSNEGGENSKRLHRSWLKAPRA